MAHLNGDRGQLLLVGGIVVAFAIVGVAIVLNTVVLTDAIESREPPRDVDRAQEHAEVTEEAVEGIVEENEFTVHPNWSVARANGTRDVARLGSLLGNRTRQGTGAHTNVTVNATRRGAALDQTNESRNFTSADADADWTLATTAGIRNYVMTVDISSLSSVNDTTATDVTLTELPGFKVEVAGNGGDTWRAFLTRTSGNELRIVTRFNTNTPEIACVRSANTIDWTRGVVGGDPCDFTFARDLTEPYTLRYGDGTEANGTYHLVVSNTSSDTVETGEFSDALDEPHQHPAVYSFVVTSHYVSRDVDRDTDVRVAPGEPLETRPDP